MSSPTHAACRLAPQELHRACDVDGLPFATTEEVEPADGMIGQDRALEAIDFGLGIDGSAYNLFVTGAMGTGKRTVLEQRLRAAASDRPSPPDWVYLFNFDDPGAPLSAQLPSGRAHELAAAMTRFVADARREIPKAFESSSYHQRRREIEEEFERQQHEAFSEIEAYAREHDYLIEMTPAGVAMVPLVDGHPARREEFDRLTERRKEAAMKTRHTLEQRLTDLMLEQRARQRDARERVRALDRDVGMFAVGHLVDEVRREHTETEAVCSWLDQVREDVLEHLEDFRSAPALDDGGVPPALAGLAAHATETFFARYEVNVFVAHENHGAPVERVVNPTYHGLFGRIEYESMLGAVATDHRHLRAGAIHRASGGYLLLDAIELLSRPFLWDKLKEVLHAGRARLENLGEQFMLFPTTTLTPDPVPVDLKVVLVGQPQIYRLLYALDSDTRELFRVKAEFDSSMPWTPEHERDYAAFVSARVRERGKRHLDRAAMARVVEHGARRSDHREKLTTRFGEIASLVDEADHWAGAEGAELVGAEHVERAIAQRVHRANLVEDKLDELVDEGTLVVDVDGARVGELNGLAVIDLGDHRFGRPVRVSASTGVGRGGLVSIDRESKLSGHVHDKGFLIVTGFLQARFGSTRPLSLAGSLTFEQSYDEIEGDSASSTELYALLSSLSNLPLDQGIAVTGSVDQHGRVQAIGGVNEKVEGFFEVCRRRGLTGRQGVLMPRANAVNLMLRREVVEAVRAGRFHVWAVDTVDDGIEILTGVPAGRRADDGTYAEGSVHALVDARLGELAEAAREHAEQPESEGEPA